MDEDLNLLAKELTNAAGSIATQNGGGEHGYVGMFVKDAKYISSDKQKTQTCDLPLLSQLSKHPENLNLLFVNGKQNPKEIRHL